jgi:hypothetical protein
LDGVSTVGLAFAWLRRLPPFTVVTDGASLLTALVMLSFGMEPRVAVDTNIGRAHLF